MIDETLDRLKKLSDYCDSCPTEDKDTEIVEEAVCIIANELWELGILINKLKQKG